MLCFSCPVRWYGIALSNLLTGTAWRYISAVSKLMTTGLVSQFEWRIGTDTGCAGCRRVEQRVAVKSTHTCEQRQLVTAVAWVEQQVQWWGTGCYSQEGDGQARRKGIPGILLFTYVYLLAWQSIRENLSANIPLLRLHTLATSGKTETTADCSWYIIVATFPARLFLSLI